MSKPFQIDDLTLVRERLAGYGYHVFLTPDRPTGWWAVLQPDDGGVPTELRGATRAEALNMAEGIASRQRLSELDRLVRERGLVPPSWTGTLDQQSAILARFAAEHGIAT